MKIGYSFPHLDFPVEEMVFYCNLSEEDLVDNPDYETFFGEAKLKIIDIRLEKTYDGDAKLIIELGLNE